MRPVRINGSVTFVRHVGDRRAFLDARCPHGHPPLSLEAAFLAASFLSGSSAMIRYPPIREIHPWPFALP
jgi:hypothetical protein